jgi:hypothetical protein
MVERLVRRPGDLVRARRQLKSGGQRFTNEDMKTLSEHFGLNRAQAELDFVDVPINGDLGLFVDPFTFTVRDDAWSFACNESVLSFFSAALDCVR